MLKTNFITIRLLRYGLQTTKMRNDLIFDIEGRIWVIECLGELQWTCNEGCWLRRESLEDLFLEHSLIILIIINPSPFL